MNAARSGPIDSPDATTGMDAPVDATRIDAALDANTRTGAALGALTPIACLPGRPPFSLRP